jgi:hypothetical protein
MPANPATGTPVRPAGKIVVSCAPFDMTDCLPQQSLSSAA